MELIITLRKTVADQAAGEQIFDFVKAKLAQYPDVLLSAHCVNHFASNEPPNDPE